MGGLIADRFHRGLDRSEFGGAWNVLDRGHSGSGVDVGFQYPGYGLKGVFNAGYAARTVHPGDVDPELGPAHRVAHAFYGLDHTGHADGAGIIDEMRFFAGQVDLHNLNACKV
ncbi:MAG: hypothetical protein QN172_00960 [Armatimonadota bacterium]|nr:hypothetical protein [Armatimonadota bacterium]MDR7566935.1 hypothetical protein [Armatimonadota bacterium]MDR7601007.1 hypothetical protein [Armatimonadota bacterium]